VPFIHDGKWEPNPKRRTVMAAKPSRKDVSDFVIETLRKFSGNKKLTAQDGDKKLQQDLNLDKRSLKFLAMSLRGYIRRWNPDATIKASEISKKATTVKDVISLVTTRALG
jgi:hypothetical protein